MNDNMKTVLGTKGALFTVFQFPISVKHVNADSNNIQTNFLKLN